MALTKQNLPVPFVAGVDQKTDPKQLDFGKFAVLENVVFSKDKRLDKRNGFERLSLLPEGTSPTTLTTFDSNLTVIGNSVQSYVAASSTWLNKGRFQPIQLSTLSVQKNSASQSSVDCAYSGTGLVCITYLEGSTWKYQINDSNTGAALVSPIALPTGAANVHVTKVDGYFFITYVRTVAATPRLRCLPIPFGAISTPLAEEEISNLVLSATSKHDAYGVGNQMFIAWEASDGGGAVRVTILDNALNLYTPTVITGSAADIISLTVDTSTVNYVVWVTWHTTSSTTTRSRALNALLVPIIATTTISSTGNITNLASVAQDGLCTIFRQLTNTYSFSSVRSDIVQKATIDESSTVVSPSTLSRGLGIASKAFIVDGLIYYLAVRQSTYQPSYYLIDNNNNCVARLAYSNGSGYITTTILSSVTVNGTVASCAYLVRDQLTPVNKEQNPDSVGGLYTGTGINLVAFDTAKRNLATAEIGGNLHIAGGYVWNFDGVTLSEQGFQYWPEDMAVTTSTAGGNLSNQDYYYQVVYEWTDAKGNIHRSAPSIPVSITATGGAHTNSNTLQIPTLRTTYKPDVRIVIYRWSTAQQNYYQVTSVTSPTLNNTSVDSITFVDTLADSSIIGNPLIYTTGGVVENIPAPACSSLSLYQSRLVLISSEDPNVVWYSKQVVQNTPVETSDLFTIYVAPSIGGQGSTGNTEVLYPLDEKLLFFKSNAVYFMTGNGPDATGLNNDFSEPAFITAAVGSVNQDSMATIPQGVLFQSNKGVWLLSRELSTSYIGSSEEDAALADTVTSSQAIPGATQVRLTLENGTAIVYDYYYDRWYNFTNIPAISSTVYNGLHTYLTSSGEVRQESPSYYKDGLSNPVQMRVVTPWYNLAGLQGFQRAMQVYILGTYATPHTIRVSVSYDYEDSPSQVIDLTPQEWMGTWGDEPLWGSNDWGGGASLEQYRIFLNRQKMQAFKLDIQELYDSSAGEQPGAGLSLSGLNIVVATKKGYVPLPASRSFG